MAWDQESLWAKAKLFIERAFDQQEDDSQFGLWAALSMELLARSALAAVSPTLLAEPEPNHRNLLHALGRGTLKSPPRSVGATQVFQLCRSLFEGISETDITAALALVNRRNEELHSGAAAFDEYATEQWLVGFHRICKALCEAQSRSLSDFYGEPEAIKAAEMILNATEETKSRVKSLIASHKRVFDEKTATEKQEALENGKKQAKESQWRGHHLANCPACKGQASVHGENYGKESVTVNEDGEVVIKQSMIPRSFRCHCCGLTLKNVGELDAAGLGGRYTSTNWETAAAYFGLSDRRDDEGIPYMDE